jgi:hypothetical protein
MRILKRTVLFLILLYFPDFVSAQSFSGIMQINSGKDLIRISNIKSKSVHEYRYTPGTEELADSGYKSKNFTYDKLGRLTGYVNYHVHYTLTVKEFYTYSGDNIVQTMKYNSAEEMIQTIDYVFNKSGKLKREIHTSYYNSVRPGVHFSILANINENEVFSKLQDELEIEPKLESYTITVNISDPDELNQYVVIGDELDPTSPRYSWSQLSTNSQRELLAYTGPNRKEHTYKSKNIARVNYKYDRKGNLIRRTVYNTADDLIEKETFMYNGDNQKISQYKYNEKGKITGMETYVYDAQGKLIESTGLDPSGMVMSRLKFVYGESGLQEEKIWINHAGEIKGRFEFVYDEYGKLLEEIKYRDENEKEGRTVHIYNENGNIIEIIRYGADETKLRLTKYVYENW